MHELWKKNLVQFTKVVQLERDAARIAGERGALLASIAQTELKILQVDEDMRQDVGKDMADIRAKTSELAEKRVVAEDKVKRIDIRAPQDGVVHQLNVHTVGGVIAPPSVAAEPIMLIVPETDKLDCGGQGAAPGRGSIACRAIGHTAVLGIQSTHDPGTERCIEHGVGGRCCGSEKT